MAPNSPAWPANSSAPARPRHCGPGSTCSPGRPSIIPAAAIRPGAAAFAAGMVIFVAGLALRLRHPAYAGGLLFYSGIGAMSANWVGLAAMTLLPLAVIVWRIHIEENALLKVLDDRYRRYASHHKRLVPLIW